MYTIYSKIGCASCVAAKKLLDAKGEEVEYLVLGQDFELSDFVAVAPSGFRSFPLIFKDDQYVGSFADLQKTFA